MNHIPEVQMSPHLSALRCMFLVALHHGIQVPPEKFAVADENDSLGSLLLIRRNSRDE